MEKKVYALLSSLVFLFSCSSDNNATSPTSTTTIIKTALITNVSFTTAIGGGIITSDGGEPITAKGVIYSTNHNPTLENKSGLFSAFAGTGSESFSSLISNMDLGTTYYVRAYVINSLGTFYGNEVALTTKPFLTGGGAQDFDGNKYNAIILGGQEWLQSNLNVTHYRNGDLIPEEEDVTKWENLTTGAWCYAESKTENGIVYGKLYNWYAMNDPRGLAPLGWHIPSNVEWATLTDFLGGEMLAGGRMKENGSSHWTLPNLSATNGSGFTALPAGIRTQNYSNSFVKFESYWWGTTANADEIFTLSLVYNTGYVTAGRASNKNIGLSVRCVKD